MKRATRELWRSAETLADLGELTALWLEGVIESHPGSVHGRFRRDGVPEEETTELIPVLAAVNRAGFLTDCSQPGYGPAPAYGADEWCQRAAVSGFADPELARVIEQAAGNAGLMVQSTRSGQRHRLRDRIPVSTCDGQTYTAFGAITSTDRDDEIALQFEVCNASAQAAVLDAVELVVADPEWGRVDSPLWLMLADVARRAGV